MRPRLTMPLEQALRDQLSVRGLAYVNLRRTSATTVALVFQIDETSFDWVEGHSESEIVPSGYQEGCLTGANNRETIDDAIYDDIVRKLACRGSRR